MNINIHNQAQAYNNSITDAALECKGQLSLIGLAELAGYTEEELAPYPYLKIWMCIKNIVYYMPFQPIYLTREFADGYSVKYVSKDNLVDSYSIWSCVMQKDKPINTIKQFAKNRGISRIIDQNLSTFIYRDKCIGTKLVNLLYGKHMNVYHKYGFVSKYNDVQNTIPVYLINQKSNWGYASQNQILGVGDPTHKKIVGVYKYTH